MLFTDNELVLFILDGKKTDLAVFKTIDPDQIESSTFEKVKKDMLDYDYEGKKWIFKVMLKK